MIADFQITHVHSHLEVIVNQEDAWHENLMRNKYLNTFFKCYFIQYLCKQVVSEYKRQ